MPTAPAQHGSDYDFNAALDRIELVQVQSEAAPKVPEYAEFDGTEYQLRYARLQELMRAEGIDYCVLTQEENLRYFTGYLSVLWISRFRPFVVILPADAGAQPTLVLPGQERQNAELTSWVPNVVTFPPQEDPVPVILNAMQGYAGPGRAVVGFELGFGQRLGMSEMQYRGITAGLGDSELADIGPLVQTVRMLKSAAERDRLRMAANISLAGIAAGWKALRPGITERELLSVVGSEMYRLGAEVGTKPSFFGTLAGERWHMANAVPSEYVIKVGDLILLDGGATYGGYTCDLIRQASMGPVSALQRDWFDGLIAANKSAQAALRVGATAAEVYKAGLDGVTGGAAEFNRMNIIGHGIGTQVHELPWLGEEGKVYTSDVRIREGMVFAVEPGVARTDGGEPSGHFIVEEIVAVTADGPELLSTEIGPELYEAPAS